ncbi:reverse transcriptase domain-containing protein [Tanacetum coccineum]
MAISFPPLGEEDGTEGPMIIEAEMGGHFVHRVYVDGGASSEVLYEHCFVKLRKEIRDQMVQAHHHLSDSAEETIGTSQIALLVKIGDEVHSTFAWMNFMIIRSPSQHNAIIGISGIRKIRAVPSTAHGMLKFPVEDGTVTLQSSRVIPMECAMILELDASSAVNQVLEEKINIAIHPEYPEQTVAIGSTLTEKGRKELFRQKKRGQAPKRNKAIQEEVEKLVDAGIMKEVHYHSWLSNPVMVKKHDGTWRIENEMDHEVEERCDLFEDQEQTVSNIRRFEMIKYSFGQDEEYVVVKEDVYDDLTNTSEDACRAYQEIFRMMDEGWLVTRAE